MRLSSPRGMPWYGTGLIAIALSQKRLGVRFRPNIDFSLTTPRSDAPTLIPTSVRTAAMPLNREPKYPSRRAYVLKVRGDATSDELTGRLENLVTGVQLEFASGHELLESIARDLEVSGALPEEAPRE